MAFVWQDKENGVDDILAEHINGVAHEVIRLEEDKANNDLSNVNDNVFKNKALSAGIEGKVSSVNGKVGDVILSANDVEAYSQISGINITSRGIEIHSFSDKNIILFTHRDDGSFAVHDLTQKADKAQEIFEEDLDTIILTNNQPKLFKVSKTSIGMISAFNPYYVYYGEISPLVDGKTTHLYQYKITGTGIYFRTGTRQPTSPEQSWQEWTKIGSGDGGGAVSSVNGQVGDVELTATDVDAYPKAEVDNIIGKKLDKPTLNTTSNYSLILTHNQEARLGEIATLTLSMPSTIDDLYWSSFCFASGATATSISYSGEPIIWCGDDCDADGSFIPEANTKYEVHIKKLGSDIVARVGAY